MSLALPLAGAALTPSEADACSPDPCSFVEGWDSLEPVNAASIPIDGVLVLRGTRQGDVDEDWLSQVELTVTRDGQPIAGAVEATEVRDVLIWRPAAPLEPGATYQVKGNLDNDETDEYYEGCHPDILALDFEFQADTEPSAPLTAPKTSAQESVFLLQRKTLDDVVCCDGAYPNDYGFDCGYGGESVYWDEGFCAATRGFGSLNVDISAEVDVPPATAQLLARELFLDGVSIGSTLDGGALGTTDSKPFCTSVKIRNLATGESVMSEAICHGAEVADQLGDQILDPSAELGQKCKDTPYVCTVKDGQWDETQCSAWPGEEPTTGDPDPTEGPTSDPSGDPSSSDGTDSDDSATAGQDGLVDHGCACDSSTPSPLGALALLGLGLLRPRRRRWAPR